MKISEFVLCLIWAVMFALGLIGYLGGYSNLIEMFQ